MNKMKMLYVILSITVVALSFHVYAYIATTGDMALGQQLADPFHIGDIGIGIGIGIGTGDGGDDGGSDDPGDPDYYDCNVDLENKGPNAYDLAIVLKGNVTIDCTYDGYTSGNKIGWFEKFTQTYDSESDTTTLHWEVFKNNSDDTIETGDIIHVGWSYEGQESQVVDMYWTDKNGNRVPGSIVYNIDADWTYYTSSGILTATWANVYLEDTPITVSDIHVAYVPQKIELANLNAENTTLNETLQPLEGGQSLDIPHGYQHTLQLPAGAELGTVVVLRYRVSGAGADAEAINYFQFVVR